MRNLFLGLLLLNTTLSIAQPTDASNHAKSEQIRNESSTGGNTKARVADAFQGLNDGKESIISGVVASGTNTYSATVGSTVTSYVTGQHFYIRFTNTNTSASPTLKLNTLSFVPLVDVTGTGIGINGIPAGSYWDVLYDGTNFQLTGYQPVATSRYHGSSPTTSTVGGLPAGSTITNRQYDSLFQAILVPYIQPTFSAFSVNVSQTLEVGSSITSGKTAAWTILPGSGTVSTVDLLDVTASTTLLSGTPNDGSQAFTATTIQLNSNGATQVWRMVGNNSSPSGTFNSSNYTVTSRFYVFYDQVTSFPTNSAGIRALSNSFFYTGGTTFDLAIGTTGIKRFVALPLTSAITHVSDVNNLGNDITANYVLQGSTINVIDAGGTNRAYHVYQMSDASPYPLATIHRFTIN